MCLKSEEAWRYNIQILSYENRARKSLLTSEVNGHADGSLCHKQKSPRHHYHGAETAGAGREKMAGSGFMSVTSAPNSPISLAISPHVASEPLFTLPKRPKYFLIREKSNHIPFPQLAHTIFVIHILFSLELESIWLSYNYYLKLTFYVTDSTNRRCLSSNHWEALWNSGPGWSALGCHIKMSLDELKNPLGCLFKKIKDGS